MQRVALRDVDLASFRAAVGPEGCADGACAVARGAVVQMAWEASQQLLTGTVRDSGVKPGGEIRTVSASFRASPGFPLRFREGYCSCASGHQLRARRRARARRDRRDAAARDRAGRDRGPPLRAALGAVARLAARRPAGPRPRPAPATPPRARRSRSSCPWCRNTPEPVRYPATPRTTGCTSRPPTTPSAGSSSRRGWCSRAASAAGWPATCPGPGLTTCCCATSSPPRTCACCTSSTPCTGPAPPPSATGYHTQVRLPRLRRPEVPGPVRVRVPPALAGPRPGARGRAALRLPGQAGHRAAARHGRAVPRRHHRRHHAADRPGHQDRRRRGRRAAAVHRHRGPRRRLRRPRAGRPGRARPVPARPARPIRCPRSCSSWPSPTSGSSSPRPGRPRSCPGTTRGCAARPP